MATPKRPKWLRDIDASLAIRSHFVLSGNIRDYFLVGHGGPAACPIVEALWRVLEPRGFYAILVWDPIDGLTSFPPGRAAKPSDPALPKSGNRQPANLMEILRAVAAPEEGATSGSRPERKPSQPPVALVVDYASRVGVFLDNPTEKRLFVAAEKAAAASLLVKRQGPGPVGPACFNPVVWLANRANDLPFWFTADNERIASIPVPLPSADDRRAWAHVCYDDIEGERDIGPEEFAAALAGLTHGMTLVEMQSVTRLARSYRLAASEVDDAVERFRVGDVDVDENPWRTSALRERIADGAAEIDRYVKGQERARARVLDILKRTSIGLTGAQASSSGARPRGILFFAGPTGVGKTEMAKTIARIVFGDPDACLRFDMSEFKGEHSGDRLIGAPPGYVGFDQGGELTNAMRENPFRVLLFDEIEKAHPRILDKFLQVLDDGRLTDGRGETVYFSESLIVFTSNEGLRREDSGTGEVRLVSREDQERDPDGYERQILDGIKTYFHHKLERPELHNRLGENVVVFNYITGEVAEAILDAMVERVRDACREDTSLELEITDDARKQLVAYCTGGDVLSNGGRGIGSKLEAVLVNPLARHIFDNDLRQGRVVVSGFRANEQEGTYALAVSAT